MRSRSIRSARRRCATFSTFPATSPRRPKSSRWSGTTARRSRSSPRPTPSSILPPSASPKTSGRTGASADLPALVNVADDTAQAGYIVERILENREAGIALKSQAVLFRASHHSARLEVELTRRNIPFVKFGGLKFLEAAHIKDVLAVLRWANNPRDRVAGFRVAQLLPGIGPGSARAARLRWRKAATPARPCERFKPPAAAAEHWQDFEATIGMLRLQCGRLAGRTRSRLPLVWAASRAHYEDAAHPRGRPGAACADCLDLSEPRTLPDRADARSAGCDQRRGRRAAAR